MLESWTCSSFTWRRASASCFWSSSVSCTAMVLPSDSSRSESSALTRVRRSTEKGTGESSMPRSGQQHTKFGDGTRYSFPVYLISPELKLKANTAIESVSWLATTMYCPEESNWKWRGVSPRVWKNPTIWSWPRCGPLELTRKIAIDSCPRLETMTKRPFWWTHMRPHVFIVVQKADGTVLMDWIKVSVDRPLKRSMDSLLSAAMEISSNSWRSTAKTAI